MSKLKEMIDRTQEKRDERIRAWLKEQKSISWIARQLDVSRQRVQQIVNRLKAAV